MAFKIGNRTVLHDADPSAALLTNSNQIVYKSNGTDVLTHDGSTITLKNVALDQLINPDNVNEGTTNLTDAEY